MVWWNKPLRVLQLNIEDPYGFYADRIDSELVVKIANRVKANMIIVFGRDAWGRVFYPRSRLYPRHHNSRLDLSELTEKAGRLGIKVVAMMAHTANRYLYRIHPEWAQRNSEGEVIVLEHYPSKEKVTDPHWPLICPNSPALENYFVKEVEEAIAITNADGVLLDSFRYLPDPPKACYCSYCTETFKKETGLELPRNIDPENTASRVAWDWRYEVVKRSIARMRDAIKKIKPDAIFFYNSHPAGWAGRGNIVVVKSRDYLDAVFAEASEADIRGPGLLTIVTKLTKALIGDDKPVLVSRNLFYILRPVQSAPENVIRQGVWEIVASGGHPIATVFSSQLFEDPRGLDALAAVYDELDRVSDYLRDLRPVRYIGIVFDPETHDKYYWRNPDYYIGEIEGFSLMAMHKNLPWSYIATPDIADLDKLKQYPIIIAAGMSMMNDREEEAFKQYVEDGGILVATHEFGVMRSDYSYRHALALQDVFGINYEGLLWFGYSYLDLGKPGEEIYETYWRNMPSSIVFGDQSVQFVTERFEPRLGELVRARPIDCKVLAWGKLGRSAYGYEYTLGRSTPAPGSVINLAGITVKEYGSGVAIYYSVRLGAHYSRLGHPDYAELLLRPLKRHGPRSPIRVEGPENLQVEPYVQGDRYIVFIINHSYNQLILSTPTGPSKQALPAFDPSYRVHPIREIIPVAGVKLYIDIEDSGKSYRAYSPLTNKSFKVDVSDRSLKVYIDLIKGYELIVIEPGG